MFRANIQRRFEFIYPIKFTVRLTAFEIPNKRDAVGTFSNNVDLETYQYLLAHPRFYFSNEKDSSLFLRLECIKIRFILDYSFNLIFRWPCFVIYPYNMNQQDALFSINLLQQQAATCFEQACCSSSGGSTLYKQQLVQ